jgi:hypothetical protein
MKRKWPFWVILAVLVVVWGIAQMPRAQSKAEDGSSTTYKAGLPFSYSKWDVWTHNGEKVNSTSSPGMFLLNALPLALSIGAAWYFTRPKEEESKPRRRVSRSHHTGR